MHRRARLGNGGNTLALRAMPRQTWRMRWNRLFPNLLLAAATPSGARELPPGFVYLRDVAPAVLQEMRYAGADNFTGQPLPGYGAAECALRRDAALALAKVEADLARRHLTLKTYDCYRPTGAVRAMARWAAGAETGVTRRFYPRLDKSRLFELGYIAQYSRHSTGTAIDLTLVQLPAPRVAPFDPRAQYGACTAPAPQRAPDNSLDMGTGFDCFSRKSWTASAAITRAEARNRALLGTAMRKRGFKNYFREWWHFEFAGPAPRRAYDVPIGRRQP